LQNKEQENRKAVDTLTKPTILPSDYAQLEPFFNVIRQVRAVITYGSAQWLEIGMYIGEDGHPRRWTAVVKAPMFPRNGEVEGQHNGVVKIVE